MIMRLTVLCALFLAITACGATDSPPGDAATATAGCEAGEKPLQRSGLCQRQASALLLNPSTAPTRAMDGCSWVIRDAAFATDVLLYRTLRCGGTETAVELQVGNHMSELTYIARTGDGAIKNADGNPLVLARIFAGNPDGRARALWETRDSVTDKEAAKRCDLKVPYNGEGLPGDARIVDIARTPADLAREDAVPMCGQFGYNPAGGSIDFWRTHQGYAWFFGMGTDVWDVDPGSFTLIRKNDAGAWEQVPSPS